ncbi:hypothetical protein JW851_04780 [Candidatus Woesearchaeota archaeon]|nr:hypothetical protein [Candidatus Woesearchaeota archaeon]
MDKLLSIINQGEDKAGKWYIVSEGISSSTGKEKLLGFKIKEINNEYLCSCTIPPFRKQEEECIHIISLKDFKTQLKTKGEQAISEKQQEIISLEKRIKDLNQNEEAYMLEIQSLEQQKNAKEAECELYQDLLEKQEEEINQQKQETYKLQSILDSIQKAKGLESINIPPELESGLTILFGIEKDTLIDKLGPEIYKQIPDSIKKPQDKIKLGNIEHGYPKRYKQFIESMSNDKKIEEIRGSVLSSAKYSRVKRIYNSGKKLPDGQIADCWTIHMVYARDNFGGELYLKTTATTEMEAKAIKKVIESKLKV